MGRWYLQDTVVCEAEKWMRHGAAYYVDEYVKERDRWLISHCGYERSFEYVADLPAGFELSAMSAALSAAKARTQA